MADGIGDLREDLGCADRRRARQVPDTPDRAFVRTQRRETRRDVGDVAVGVREVGVAEEVGTLARERVGKDPLAERYSVTPAPKKSDALPIAIFRRPACAASRSSLVIAARVRPLTVVAASGVSSVIGLPPVGP